MSYTKKCAICGKSFESQYLQSAYCSIECRKKRHSIEMRAYNLRKKEERKPEEPGKKKETAICEKCGKSFTKKNNAQRFCCLACRKAAKKVRQKTEEYEEPKKIYRSPLEQMAFEATARHMTYGTYVVWLERSGAKNFEHGG